MKKISLDWLKRRRYHFLIWAIFMAYETMVIGFAYKNFTNPLVYVAHYAVNIALFYVNAIWFLPWALEAKQYRFLKLFIGFPILLYAYIWISYVVDWSLVELQITTIKEIKMTNKFVLQAIWRFVYFTGFSTGYYLVNRYINERNKAAEKEKEALIRRHEAEAALSTAQNAFLKAQINPHFLFNSLDFVYHSIDNDSERAAEAILLLSRMMRYAVKSDETHDFIYLEDEIEQVENLLYLHQLRKTEELPVQLICAFEVRTVKFIPLVLLTLVENVLKHGDLSNEMDEAAVMVYIDKGTLHIETDNMAGLNQFGESSHIGLANIRKRLEFAYGPVSFEHQLLKNGRFIVHLAIPLESLTVHDQPKAFSANNDRQLSHEGVGLREIVG
ncbi:MAG: histidine kinase [Pedobacter sp.]|nr:histidine kinase [Pedobacter sp.]MDQ8051581.1 histidine kinase [Pedobacter sp.]